VAKPNRKRPLGRTRLRWKNIINMFLRKLGGGMGWIDLAQGRDRWRAGVYAGMKFQFS
jgi:hypothetical protein